MFSFNNLTVAEQGLFLLVAYMVSVSLCFILYVTLRRRLKSELGKKVKIEKEIIFIALLPAFNLCLVHVLIFYRNEYIKGKLNTYKN